MSSPRPRKRDRIRDLFPVRSKSPQNSATLATPASSSAAPTNTSLSPPVPASSSPSPPAPSAVRPGFFEAACNKLQPDERTVVKKHVILGTHDIRVAVEQACAAAEKHKQTCDNKRWRWNVGGREIILRDEANKVLRWLDRFKAVGDIAANAAPIHVGLPWAGIRLLLEMSISDDRQMGALLTGMDLALYMSNRLKVYLDYFACLPQGLATTNFEQSLILFYAHILSFIAAAIQTYRKNTAVRTWTTLWQEPTITDFETEGDKLASRTEIEASNCDRVLYAQHRDDAKQWKNDMQAALRRLDDIRTLQNAVDLLHQKVDLSKLATAPGATYNSYAEADFAQCLAGTRTQLLQQITDWVDDPHGKCIFWLCGMAGTGKSTIARTVAQTLDDQGRLGASFFFKRGEGDRGRAMLFFPTIVTQLADRVPAIGSDVAKALDADSLLCERNLREQFEKLLLQPLLDAAPSAMVSNAIVVVDALDECDRSADIKTILTQLARLGVTSTRMRVFVTSRPELPIRLGFRTMDGALHEDVALENVQAPTIANDIHIYFKYRFQTMQLEDELSGSYEPLPLDWPGEKELDALVQLASPLFIFAVTVCRYVSESDPQGRLERVLQQRGDRSVDGIENTYLPILNHLVLDGNPQDQDQALANFRDIVGTIVLLAEPLSAASLSTLLDVPLRKVGETLKHLHSVLSIPSNSNEPIRLLHLSFRDFLVDSKRKERNRFWIDAAETHGRLAKRCLDRLSQPGTLKKDICNVVKPGTRRANISKQRVAEHIPGDVSYACRYWALHLAESGEELDDDGYVYHFLRTHFLHWTEALAWLGGLAATVDHRSRLRTLGVKNVQEEIQDKIAQRRGSSTSSKHSQMLAFLNDANRFFPRNRGVIDLAPLQLYHSALLFLPTQSVIRKLFIGQHPQLTSSPPSVPWTWDAEILKLEGHEKWVRSVAFSPDGQMIASASDDGTVRLWNASTGELMQKLEGHKNVVMSVAFSPDGNSIASGSQDYGIRLWNTASGEEILKLEGHNDWVMCVAFSPDGYTIASASYDRTVRLWNTATGSEIRRLEGHESFVMSVCFSPDGHVIASASDKGALLLWNVATGEAIQELGDGVQARSVAFSPDGLTVAAVSSPFTSVRMWNVAAWQEILELTGHSERITAVVFSRDGRSVASASSDGTVRLWDAATGKETQRLGGHGSSYLSVAMSPDAHIVAAASLDNTVRLWDVVSGNTTQTPERPRTRLQKVLVSPNGEIVAVVSSSCIALLDTSTSEEIRRLEAHEPQKFHWEVAFATDGSLLASTHRDHTVRLWKMSSGEQLHKLEGHTNLVLAVNFSPDGNTLASLSHDDTLRLWDMGKGKEMHKFSKCGSSGLAVFSLDGESVASASFKTLRLFNVKTGKEMQRFKGHQDRVTQIAFCPNNQGILASTSVDKTIRLWNVASGKGLLCFETNESVHQIEFSDDGQFLETENERFELGRFATAPFQVRKPSTNVSRDNEWIQHHGEDVLWLPHEYRPEDQDHYSTYGDMLVIGQRNGEVAFHRLKQAARTKSGADPLQTRNDCGAGNVQPNDID